MHTNPTRQRGERRSCHEAVGIRPLAGASGFYRLDRARILELLQDLVASPNVVLVEPRAIIRAVQVFGSNHIDFVDAYLAALAQETKTVMLATFNKRDFRRFPWLKLIP